MPGVPSHTKFHPLEMPQLQHRHPGILEEQEPKSLSMNLRESQLRSQGTLPPSSALSLFISIGPGGTQLLSQFHPRLPTIALDVPSLLLPGYLSYLRSLCIRRLLWAFSKVALLISEAKQFFLGCLETQ